MKNNLNNNLQFYRDPRNSLENYCNKKAKPNYQSEYDIQFPGTSTSSISKSAKENWSGSKPVVPKDNEKRMVIIDGSNVAFS